MSTPTARARAEQIVGPHRYCEDCWYSCPQSEDGCCDSSQGDKCNCGREERIAAILAYADEIRREERARTLDAVQTQAELYLYTNTKNGNRRAVLNIVKRLRQPADQAEGTEERSE